MAKPEERRVPDERGARAEAAGRAKRGDSAGAATGDAAHGDSDGQDPAVSTCAEADEREVEGATFFANTACRWFPCHETADPEHFNCLFCFCPLYPLGEACGGDFAGHLAAERLVIRLAQLGFVPMGDAARTFNVGGKKNSVQHCASSFHAMESAISIIWVKAVWRACASSDSPVPR